MKKIITSLLITVALSAQVSIPATPSTGAAIVYNGTDGNLRYVDSTGTTIILPGKAGETVKARVRAESDGTLKDDCDDCITSIHFAAPSTGTTTIRLDAKGIPYPQDIPGAEYLLEYTTTEKDYQSGHVYAVMCGPKEPDCDVPRKTVTHYQAFSTAKAAIDWVNCWDGCQSDPGAFFSCSSVECTTVRSGTISVGPPINHTKAFVRLLVVRPVSVASSTSTKEIPQPAVKETKTVYRLSK